MSPFGLEAPQLSTAHRPNSAGYLGYLDSSQQQALDRHVNREAIEWQPMVLLYNQPAHCDNAGLYQGFMRMERDFRDRRGEYEADWPGGLLRDGSDAQAPFRTRRAPQRYRHAPSRKLIVDQRYSLEDLLDEPGYARTLDGSEETQRVVLFSAIDPATPIGFVVLHRRVALEREHLCVDLFPNFFYVAPPTGAWVTASVWCPPRWRFGKPNCNTRPPVFEVARRCGPVSTPAPCRTRQGFACSPCCVNTPWQPWRIAHRTGDARSDCYGWTRIERSHAVSSILQIISYIFNEIICFSV